MCYIAFIRHSLHWRYINAALQEYVINIYIYIYESVECIIGYSRYAAWASSLNFKLLPSQQDYKRYLAEFDELEKLNF